MVNYLGLCTIALKFWGRVFVGKIRQMAKELAVRPPLLNSVYKMLFCVDRSLVKMP